MSGYVGRDLLPDGKTPYCEANLSAVCAANFFLFRDMKKAEKATLEWADENGIQVPDDVRLAIEKDD